MYKPSMFNFVLDDEEDVVLFNAMSGLTSACRLNGELAKKAKHILLNDSHLIDMHGNENLLSMLIEKGYLVNSDCDEKQKREALFTEINSGSMLRLIILPTPSTTRKAEILCGSA